MRIIVKRIDEHLKSIENFNRDLDKTLINFDNFLRQSFVS